VGNQPVELERVVMETGGKSSTLGLLNISVFELEDQEFVERAFELIKEKYTSRLMKADEKTIEITLPDVLCTVELTGGRNYSLLSVGTRPLSEAQVLSRWQENFEIHQSQTHPILNMLPKNPLLSLSVFLAATNSQDGALSLMRQYSEHTGNSQAGVGVVNGCLLASFRATGRAESPSLNMLVSPLSAEGRVSLAYLLVDIRQLAVNLACLKRLYWLCQPYFPQVDPAEAEIHEKIEVILNRMRQTEPVELETLKLWLSDVMDRFSTLSILSALITRDLVTARTYTEENKNLLNRWGEIGLKGYPTITLMENTDYQAILQPFRDFVDRTQALRVQLESVSDMVRTYLGIQQQEQSSEVLKQQVKMLYSIEEHEKILKRLTYWVVILTVSLVTLEILTLLHVLP
jgi:hypothetical protein